MSRSLHVPLIEDLTAEPIPDGSCILVEYDPASHWFAASVTIAAGWVKNGGTVRYGVAARSPEKLRAEFNRLGIGIQEFEKNEKLIIHDWYTCTLGVKSNERFALESLRVADLSIFFTKHMMGRPGGIFPPFRDFLRILDDLSTIARFNDDKTWIEFVLSRYIPSAVLSKSVLLLGLIKGLHSDWVYKRLEASVDGIVDFRLEEGKETRNFVRIRNMRNVAYDSHWHELRVGRNFEVNLRKNETRKKYK